MGVEEKDGHFKEKNIFPEDNAEQTEIKTERLECQDRRKRGVR